MPVREQYAGSAIWHLATREMMEFFSSSDLLMIFSENENHYYFADFTNARPVIDEGLEFLVLTGLLELITDPYGPSTYSTTMTYTDGEKRLREYTPFQKLEKFGWSWLSSALFAIANEIKEEEGRMTAFDRSAEQLVRGFSEKLDWAPLPIDRNSEKYEEAIKAAEIAITTVENDNGYSVNEPDERDAIVKSAKATLETLREATPSREQVVANLVKPMKYLAKKFAETSIGVVSKRAVEAMMTWLVSL